MKYKIDKFTQDFRFLQYKMHVFNIKFKNIFYSINIMITAKNSYSYNEHVIFVIMETSQSTRSLIEVTGSYLTISKFLCNIVSILNGNEKRIYIPYNYEIKRKENSITFQNLSKYYIFMQRPEKGRKYIQTFNMIKNDDIQSVIDILNQYIYNIENICE